MKHQHLSKTQAAKTNQSPQTATNTTSDAHPVLQMQADIGNRATSHLLSSQKPIQAKPLFGGLSSELSIQPKLTIGAVGDKYEQEADTVASQVVNRMDSPAAPTVSTSNQPTSSKHKRTNAILSVPSLPSPETRRGAMTKETQKKWQLESLKRQHDYKGDFYDTNGSNSITTTITSSSNQSTSGTNNQSQLTLDQAMKDEKVWGKFVDYCDKEHSLENIDAYDLVYQLLHSNIDDNAYYDNLLNRLLNEFLTKKSPYYLNIDFSCIEKPLLDAIKKQDKDNIKKYLELLLTALFNNLLDTFGRFIVK
jgi:hypothetical protein